MVTLTDADLREGSLLDCPLGVSGFAAGARARGADVTAVDRQYAVPHDELVRRARDVTASGNHYVREM